MARIRLLQTVCTVAMLAAVPAFAQTATPPAATTGGMNTKAEHQAAPANGGANTTTMAPAEKMGTMDKPANHAAMDQPAMHSAMGKPAKHDAMDKPARHRVAMAHQTGAMHGRTDSSQNAAVDTLNDQSYQAAQKGEALGGRGSDKGSSDMTKPGGTMKPGGSTSMKDRPGRSMADSDSNGKVTKP